MNVENHPVGAGPTGHLSTSALAPIYRTLCWSDVIQIRALNPKCNPTKEAITVAAEHPDCVFGREIAPYIGKTAIGAPARNAQQQMALRRLAVLEDHEVTLDSLRDTGLPTAIAVDLVQRLSARPMGWSLFERLAITPTLNDWARSVLERQDPVHVADDVLTLRILQTFGHDVAVPWTFDVTNKWVYFYSVSSGDTGCLTRLLNTATRDRPDDSAPREACRKAYQALAYTHYGVDGQLWPHWEARGDVWEIYPDPRGETFRDDVVSDNAITCETERWLRNVTPVGFMNVAGHSPRAGLDYDSDLSDPDNLTCDPAYAPVSPSELRVRLATLAAQRRGQTQAAPLASLAGPAPVSTRRNAWSPATDQ